MAPRCCSIESQKGANERPERRETTNARKRDFSITAMIQLPPTLHEVLQNDRKLCGATLATLASFEPWLRGSHQPFFPEYTDHGPDHVEAVLHSAESLITEDALSVFSSTDAATLILATLLHDSGMHLSEDGFLELIRKDKERPLIAGIDSEPWSVLWARFIEEAQRFGERELLELFGTRKPFHEPPLDPQMMTRRDRLLIGEFLRRYHHRLCHEIALWGVPGGADERLHLADIPSDLADLVGLVARSHGMSLRICADTLRERHRLQVHKGCHAVYLMVILRISDYLQVQQERAPAELLKVFRLRSPLSRREWRVHQEIADVRQAHEDPESIFVDASPSTAQSFLRIRALLDGLQQELDSSWAVLGETYGRYPEFNKLGIVVRRVRSNLDDLEKFSESVGYVPCEARFGAATPDLLTLMTGPLYGDNPEIGIREMIQNAVDAVRELRHYEASGSRRLSKGDSVELTSDVEVCIDADEDGHFWVSVSDRGFGMTSETIVNYYLKAGASFRNSGTWRRQFLASGGRSRVLRSGRFGIGVMACFLLGDQIEVYTRHVDSGAGEGLSFNASVDTTTIEIHQTPFGVGTRIRVKISEAIYRQLEGEEDTVFRQQDRQDDTHRKWDWYCLREPSLTRSVIENGRKKLLEQRFCLPGPGADLPAEWRRLAHEDYLDIHWTYWAPSPNLVCNGIVINSLEGRRRKDLRLLREDFRLPSLSVFDSDGALPINLQRNGLTGDLPFKEELREDVCRDFLAHTLLFAPSRAVTDPKSISWYREVQHPAFGHPLSSLSGTSSYPWFCTNTGLCLLSQRLITLAGVKRAFLISATRSESEATIPDYRPRGECAIFVLPTSHTLGYLDMWVRAACDISNPDEKNRGFGPLARFNVSGGRLLLTKGMADRGRGGPGKLPKRVQAQIETEWEDSEWTLWGFGARSGNASDIMGFLDKARNLSLELWPGLVAEWFFSPPFPKEVDSVVARLWEEIFDEVVVPFSASERGVRFSSAYENLSYYIRAHERMPRK